MSGNPRQILEIIKANAIKIQECITDGSYEEASVYARTIEQILDLVFMNDAKQEKQEMSNK